MHAKGYENDTQMYFKVKGPSHCENKIKILRAQSEEMIEKHKTIHGFVDAILTPRRLEQGYEFLLEQQLDHKEIKNIECMETTLTSSFFNRYICEMVIRRCQKRML